MNKNELNAALERCFTEDANVEVYLGIKEKGFRKARFENDVQKKVASMYQTELAEKLLKNDEANLTTYSAYEGRTKDWAEFDLEMPEDLNFFDELMRLNEVEGFSFEDDGLDNIESMVIVIGNAESRVGIYKRMASINIFTKNKGLFVRKGDNGWQVYSATGHLPSFKIIAGVKARTIYPSSVQIFSTEHRKTLPLVSKFNVFHQCISFVLLYQPMKVDTKFD